MILKLQHVHEAELSKSYVHDLYHDYTCGYSFLHCDYDYDFLRSLGEPEIKEYTNI